MLIAITFFLLVLLALLACEADLGGRASSAPSLSSPSLPSPVYNAKQQQKHQKAINKLMT